MNNIAKDNPEKYVLTKEILDSLRQIEGFPIGKDEDIIALSDPPYYTACPNPWIEDFIKKYGKPYDPDEPYDVEPFAADVSEGKNDPIYNAHSYHTKVPHKAIMRYILHYTKPGDIVFDGFCGTGMTGVAAQMCANPDPEFKKKIEQEMNGVEWGARKAILCDLSPAATFIAYIYNNPINPKEFEKQAKRILKEVENECGWMYETLHTFDNPQLPSDDTANKEEIIGRINYSVWSDIFICSNCGKDIIFWNQAVDHNTGNVLKSFFCQNCGATFTKRSLKRSYETIFDKDLMDTISLAKQIPVLINYSIFDHRGKEKKYHKIPDTNDLKIINEINQKSIPFFYPTKKLPNGYNTEQPKKSHGIEYSHHFYTKRNLWILSILNDKISKEINNKALKLVFQSFCSSLSSKLSRYNFGNRGNGPLSGVLYIPSYVAESNILKIFAGKIDDFVKVLRMNPHNSRITTQSSTNLEIIPPNSIDYIFTDPPFGGNIMYSELNFLWENWLKIFTNNIPEAIKNDAQNKDIFEYQKLMEECFIENYRILKPGRWFTIEFHNSENAVWHVIQESIQRAGFNIADVRILDKKQGSFKQVTTTTAPKQDLIISAYKPSSYLEESFSLTAGTEAGVWAFINDHLRHLPVVVEKDGIIEPISERQNFLLFDRMVAFHVQRGISVPLSAGEFYAGLAQRYPERDDMYFLAEQIPAYESARIKADRVGQLSIFIHDEKSTVQWLRQELSTNPRAYAEIMPLFLSQVHQDKHENLPELAEILDQNFLKSDDGKWYVPDPAKASDLEKLRDKALLKEFNSYLSGKGNLKVFRSEAIRAGFAQCYNSRDYASIITIGNRLPPSVITEDDTLLMYFDMAQMRNKK